MNVSSRDNQHDCSASQQHGCQTSIGPLGLTKRLQASADSYEISHSNHCCAGLSVALRFLCSMGGGGRIGETIGLLSNPGCVPIGLQAKP